MEDSSLNLYLDEIGRSELLTAEEEDRLAERIQQGDGRALNKLVEANLRFVVKLAAGYRGSGLEMDDLISEGNLGMMKAAAKFAPRRGSRFVSYAAPFIRQHMERAIEQQNGLAKIPRDADVADRTANRRPMSVDAPMNGRTNMSLLSVLVNTNSPMADSRVYSEAIEQAVEFALLTLSERERQVVNAFFGIEQEHETLAEIAEDMGLKRERVRQIRDRALRRISKSYKQKLREFSSSGQ
jgi:RNA polymerase primary sigma factor